MVVLKYTVQSLGSGCYGIQARFTGDFPAVRLFSPENYGPCTHYFSHFHDWAVNNEDRHIQTLAASATGNEIKLPVGTNSFSYKVEIGESENREEALFRGHMRKGFIFFLGLALFPAMDGVDVYEIEFDVDTYSGRHGNGQAFRCENRNQLFLTTYAQGEYRVSSLTDYPVNIINPCESLDRIAALSNKIPRMLLESQTWFGGELPFEVLNIFIWYDSIDYLNSGLSIDGNCCLSIPFMEDDKAAEWLLLHELLHQWIGISIKAGDSSQGWFFEGFVMCLTNFLLIRCGLDDRQRMIEALAGVVDEMHKLDSSMHDYHVGMILCHQFFHRLTQNKQSSVQEWTKSFFQRWRGQRIEPAKLVKELLSAAPEKPGDRWLTEVIVKGKIPQISIESMLAELYQNTGI